MTPEASESAAVAKELGRLVAYSFFALPAEEWHGDFAVLGTTGAFLIAVCDLPGVAHFGGRRPTIGDAHVPGLRKLRAGARRLSGRLVNGAMFARIEPMVCLIEAIAGPPAEAAGVHFVKVGDIARAISARPRVQSHTKAQAAARVLGVTVAGDQGRHFTVRG